MAKKKSVETGLTLFGVDISDFTRGQRDFLRNVRSFRSKAACARELGIAKSTVCMWEKNNPAFKTALKQIQVKAEVVDTREAENPNLTRARRQVQDIFSDAAGRAAEELVELTQKPWDVLDGRAKSTKLRAIEDVIKPLGIDSKHMTSEGKINVLQIIQEIGQERDKYIEGEVIDAVK